MFVSLCLTLPVIQRNLRMVEINKYYYYYYYYFKSYSSIPKIQGDQTTVFAINLLKVVKR